MDIKKKFQILIKIIKNKDARFLHLASRGMYHGMPDDEYLKRMYKSLMQKELDLENPKTFNEKLQWLKLYDRRPEYTRMVDKYEAKKYVASIIGEEYIIPTLGVWDHFDDIDFDILPDQFVLKCTHDSGGLVVIRNKKNINLKEIKKKIENSLRRNYYYGTREWPYKNVKPRIIVEQYLELNQPLCAEYKLFCYNGKVNWVMICKGDAHSLNNSRSNDGFDVNFNHLPVHFTYRNSIDHIEKPKEWDALISFAETLSKDIPQVRVDTYLIDGKIYFGEMTFFHDAGFCLFDPPEWDLKFGKELKLPLEQIEREN